MPIDLREVADSCIMFNNLGATILNYLDGSSYPLLAVSDIDGCIILASRDICKLLDDGIDPLPVNYDFFLIIFARRLKLKRPGNFSTLPIFYQYFVHRDQCAIGSGMALHDRGGLQITAQKIDDTLLAQPIEAYNIIHDFLKDLQIY